MCCVYLDCSWFAAEGIKHLLAATHSLGNYFVQFATDWHLNRNWNCCLSSVNWMFVPPPLEGEWRSVCLIAYGNVFIIALGFQSIWWQLNRTCSLNTRFDWFVNAKHKRVVSKDAFDVLPKLIRTLFELRNFWETLSDRETLNKFKEYFHFQIKRESHFLQVFLSEIQYFIVFFLSSNKS